MAEVQTTITESTYDRKSELIAFDETKTGVKGLVDSGIKEVPRIFIHPSDNLHNTPISNNKDVVFPVIDLDDIDEDPIKRKEVVDKVKDASASWGFFQVINHGIPVHDLEEMIRGARRFFEQDTEAKKKWYTRDVTKSVVHNSNFDLYYAPAANWRDSFYCSMAPKPPKPEELPELCREILIEYSKHMKNLGSTVLKLLSEGLGLNSDYLLDLDCGKAFGILSNYYPECPQPELTMGTPKHSDVDFFTLLLQDDLGGLQVLHQNQWVNVPPKPDALVVNIGDILQLMSNDKFKSVEHRAVVNNVGSRISIATFFSTYVSETPRLYEPIKELLLDGESPKYRAVTLKECNDVLHKKGLDGTSVLSHFKL